MTTSPISFPVHVARLPRKGMTVTVEPDEAARAALAAAHGLSSVERFEAVLEASAWKKGGVKVEGRVRADIVQPCVVTLDPVSQTVDEEVRALFLPEGSKLAAPSLSAEGEMVLDAEGDDAPELFSGDTIDVGQLAEEFFALGLDPYPRKPGAALEGERTPGDEARGPLAEKLRTLRGKL